MFDRPTGGERVIIVQLALPGTDAEAALAECIELAQAAQAEVVATIRAARAVPEAKYFIGVGKAAEVAESVRLHQADLVLVNHSLSPSQERNLERLFQCRAVDRTGLILDIFAQRAQTFEGKLQVELAQLQHMSTRLVRGWTHLERQKGGIGLRGPGETQLETDRRLLRARIKSIQQRLKTVRLNREQNRRARKRASMPIVSLVGYTNAGKSTLFNALTGAKRYAANQLFATLDPTMRQFSIAGSSPVILVDTVGFIRDLPHQLVDAFRATLQETKEADLLLHVIDLADPKWREQARAVEAVLADIGADAIPRIQVFNKIDLLNDWPPKWDYHQGGAKVWLSAVSKAGLDLLALAISTMLHGEMIEETVVVEAREAKRRAALFSMGAVLSEQLQDDGSWLLTIRLTREEKERLWGKKEKS